MEPGCVGGLGVLDPSLLLHGLRASTPVLAMQALLCQGSLAIGPGQAQAAKELNSALRGTYQPMETGAGFPGPGRTELPYVRQTLHRAEPQVRGDLRGVKLT